jgi:hypothetical protein
MLVPDTVEGSVILSIIDFILSFFIIFGIGVVLYIFPYFNRFGEIDEEKLKGGH